MTNNDIKAVQEFIKEKGLENELIFDKIMSMDPNEVMAQFEYYNSVKGKYFKDVNKSYNYVEYHYVHPDVKIYRRWDGNEDVHVVEDNYTFSTNNFVRFCIDKDHVISTTKPGRYTGCTEITKEQFDDEISKLMSFKNDAVSLLKELAYE